ncbi:sensor histidine kinase [Mangrovibacterium lignilyticum]|uniref:sensor histidine kinase n=1 Tax=Mangrovibacterium lignilyticum TaxID=2668052 RepID=UPI0013D806D9|nr:HAMP domain-containing sensor histidine kinase [Mangrovibacterium lignilyticum]
MTFNLKDISDDKVQDLVREAEFKSGKQIISLISHEMRTPLSIISSNVQLLKSFRFNLDEKMVNDTFLLCEEAISSLTDFIENVYFLNTAFKGEVKARYSPVDLNLFIDEVVNKAADSEFNRSRIKVKKEILMDPFFTDRILLMRCLDNLLVNALNFSSEDIQLEVLSRENELVITIEDQGIGIPGEEKELVFEPFKRCSNVKMISGCGIGLPIVKICVGLLGGSIDFTSKLNQGTEFIIKIRNHEC